MAHAELTDEVVKNYRIGVRLGDGGMGTVYRARTLKARKGLPADREVAIKVLHPHLAEDPDILRRFQREAGLGLTISHPRVMATYDVGSAEVDGATVHFIAMEYLRGRTLRQVLDEAGTLPDDRVVQVGRQVAEGLAEIHARGIVHRDVKPSNIFLDDERGAVIADLGLSRLVEPGSEISLPGTFLGSVAYAAPEQLESAAVGPEADLYALGVLLYEMASGKNPFAGADFKSTMHAHAHLAAPPLGRLAPNTTYFLERVIALLLVKDPAMRLRSAAQLARILSERERSEWWRELTLGDGELAALSGARRRLRVKRATRLYGRTRELGLLTDLVRTAAVGRTGRVALVQGEAGIGKSRLIDAALEAAELERIPFRAVVSRFLDLATPAPYFALSDALMIAFDLRDAPREERRKRLPALLREHLPERKVFAEAFAALIEDKDREAALQQLPGEAIPALYSEAFRTVSVRQPLVLVVEELQWADRGSLRALEALVSAMGPYPLALILTARTEILDADAEAGNARAQFARWLLQQQDSVRVDLERLDRKGVRQIVRDLAVPKETEKLLTARLHAASEGNPGFLFALLDDLEDRGKLRAPDHGEMKALALPSSVFDFLERRLDDLDPEARRFLEFASVFGTRFKLDPVVRGLGLDLVTASETVARLTRTYRVIRAFDQAYRFDHHLLRERIYIAIPPERRRSYHSAVARTLASEARDPHAPSRTAYEAGIHFSLAEEHGAAARYLVGASRYLMNRSLYERAERLAAKARAHLEVELASGRTAKAGDQFAVHEAIAAIADQLGAREVQGEALVRAVRVARAEGDQRLLAEAEVQLARHAAATGRVFAAMQHAETARKAAEVAGARSIQAAALRAEASVLQTLGQTDYESLLLDAIRLSDEDHDARGRSFALLLLAQLQLDCDRPGQALATAKDALRLFGHVKDERGRGRAYFLLARVYREFADIGRAEKALAAAAAVAAANSDRGLAARCAYLAGDLAMRRQDYVAAVRTLSAAAHDLAAAGDRTFEVYALVALAIALSARTNPERDPQRGAEQAQAAVRIAQELGLARQEAYAFAALAFAYLALGKADFALAVSKKGMRFLAEHEGGRKRSAEILFLHYRCLKALDRRDEAREYLERARDLVLERSREIDAPGYRKSFLKNDRFNGAVLREAAALPEQ